jgi:hypothetical protein
MAIAFRKPYAADTQARRDAVDMSDKDFEEVPCGRCEAAYVLVYPRSSSGEKRAEYRLAVLQGMCNCLHHPPFIELPF